jgi:dTDP-4-dehydrorhamnose 3,5-epimerase-like enzyme
MLLDMMQDSCLWNDPALGIDWQIPEIDTKLSAKDSVQPKLYELNTAF